MPKSDVSISIYQEGYGFAATNNIRFFYADPFTKPFVFMFDKTSGSVFGGTLLTIQGLNLVTTTKVMVGERVCNLLLVEAGVIKCRIEDITD